MISNKIPTLEAIRRLAERIKNYIDNIRIFKDQITIQDDSDSSINLNITSNGLECADNTNNLLIEFSPSNNKIDINNANLTNLAEPLENSDAATKQYVDNSISTVNTRDIIKLRAYFLTNRTTEVVLLNGEQITFNDLTHAQRTGRGIRLHVLSSVYETDDKPNFTVDCYVTNYDDREDCFYIPIIYTAQRNSNNLKSAMVKISASNDGTPIGELLYDTILNNES